MNHMILSFSLTFAPVRSIHYYQCHGTMLLCLQLILLVSASGSASDRLITALEVLWGLAFIGFILSDAYSVVVSVFQSGFQVVFVCLPSRAVFHGICDTMPQFQSEHVFVVSSRYDSSSTVCCSRGCCMLW